MLGRSGISGLRVIQHKKKAFVVSFELFASYKIFLQRGIQYTYQDNAVGGINVILVSMVTYIKECEESALIAKETACELCKDQQVERVNPFVVRRLHHLPVSDNGTGEGEEKFILLVFPDDHCPGTGVEEKSCNGDACSGH